MHGVAQAVGVEATYWASFSQKFDLSVMLVKYVGNNLCGNRLRRRKKEIIHNRVATIFHREWIWNKVKPGHFR